MRYAGARRTRLGIALLALTLYLTVAGLWWRSARLPRRLATVVEGQLYRSGLVLPGHLERLQRDYRIGRVVSLLAADAPVTIAERKTARRLGLEWHNIPLRGSGQSTPADRRRILDLLSDSDAPPTLVHCAAGVHRTGLAVALYRLHCQGWGLEQVLDEMRVFGFEDLPKHQALHRALEAEAEAAIGKVPVTGQAAESP